jgi:C4-dicarboxylate-specific signal transduction histidine kinase
MLLAGVMREQKRIEDDLQAQRNQLAHVTRVATVGALSGAMAHELRQPLMAILANAQAALRLVTREPVDTAELREILQDIAKQDQQAADVIARLRSFLKEGQARFSPVELDSVIRDALSLSRSTAMFAGIDVQTQIDPQLPRVRGDSVQLLQVVLNLVVNACESMHERPSADRRLRLRATSNGNGHVELLVADRGIGLPDGSEHRVFEPFFTTKEKGLGLGLAIGQSIATAHGGRLWGQNNPDGGATFHLELPVESVHDGQPAVDRDR